MLADDNLSRAKKLPDHALIINSVTDPDFQPKALDMVATYLEDRREVLLVNDPRQVAKTTRDANYKRFGKWDGVRVLVTIRAAIDDGLIAELGRKLDEWELTFPVIVRNTGIHSGRSVVRVENASELADALRMRLGSEVYLIQFVASYFRDQWFRKMRVFFIGGEIYPVVHHIDDFWNVHGTNRLEIMAKLSWMTDIERAFVSDCRAFLGDDVYGRLAKIGSEIGLDFFGIDSAVTEDGAILIYELNPTMRHSFDHAKNFPYLIEPYREIAAAFNRMLAAKIA